MFMHMLLNGTVFKAINIYEMNLLKKEKADKEKLSGFWLLCAQSILGSTFTF